MRHMLFSIAICDDDSELCARLEQTLLNHCRRDEVDVLTNGEDLIKELEAGGTYDLIFLDVHMPQQDGLQTGLAIRNSLDNQTTQIVYMASSAADCINLFEVRPNNLLLKPLSKNQVLNEVQKAKKLCGKLSVNFHYKKGFDLYTVPLQDILYFERQNKVIQIVTTHGADDFYGTIKGISNQLSPSFLQIHESTIINVSKVLVFEYDKVELTNGDVLLISQSHRKQARDFEMQLLQNSF